MQKVDLASDGHSHIKANSEQYLRNSFRSTVRAKYSKCKKCWSKLRRKLLMALIKNRKWNSPCCLSASRWWRTRGRSPGTRCWGGSSACWGCWPRAPACCCCCGSPGSSPGGSSPCPPASWGRRWGHWSPSRPCCCGRAPEVRAPRPYTRRLMHFSTKLQRL